MKNLKFKKKSFFGVGWVAYKVASKNEFFIRRRNTRSRTFFSGSCTQLTKMCSVKFLKFTEILLLNTLKLQNIFFKIIAIWHHQLPIFIVLLVQVIYFKLIAWILRFKNDSKHVNFEDNCFAMFVNNKSSEGSPKLFIQIFLSVGIGRN